MKTQAFLLCLSAMAAVVAPSAAARPKTPDFGNFKRSTHIEKERPELSEETRRLIAAYRQDPSRQNYAALKKQVEKNYDAVIARKKAKLEELRREAKHSSLVEDMEEIVDEVVKDRENRIEQSMRRFTDPRLQPGVRENKDGFLPVIGAKSLISVAYTPVTNEQYAAFLKDTGYAAPEHLRGGRVAAGQEQLPVVNVSPKDAEAYCKWLSRREGKVYRLPTEEEWEQAAGHMPKDAEFNCGANDGLRPVTAYSGTLAACGAVDMWGNCWEWTADRSGSSRKVKGGSWDSGRMDCRTENRDNLRKANSGYPNVGFRIVREDKPAAKQR